MKIYVFAGPNGSGKSTITNKFVQANGLENIHYINADNIARILFSHIENYDDRNMAAAIYAEQERQRCLNVKQDFMFETVLSTDRNLNFLQKAKSLGASIAGVYVLTRDPQINIKRVCNRIKDGGHGVPEDKIVSRYYRCLQLLPNFVDVVDRLMLYDNTENLLLTLVKEDGLLTAMTNTNDDSWLEENIIAPLKAKGYVFNYKNNVKFDDEDIYNLNILNSKQPIVEEINRKSE